MRCIALILLLPALAFGAKENYGTATVASIYSIYDADTFRVNIEGWPDIIGKSVPIRVNGVDAPEIRGKCLEEKARAREAKQFTIEKLQNSSTIELQNMTRGKYFRILADVYVDGESLSELLINEGLARPYQGGTRLGWCDLGGNDVP